MRAQPEAPPTRRLPIISSGYLPTLLQAETRILATPGFANSPMRNLCAAVLTLCLATAAQPQGLLVDADDGESLAAARLAVPILAVRRCERRMSLAEARAACDELHAKLAGRVEVAGLAVMSF